MMQVMTLTCSAIIVNKLRSTKGRFLLEKRLFKAAVKWCLEQVSEGFQVFFLFFVFSELSQGRKHHLFVPLVGMQVKI